MRTFIAVGTRIAACPYPIARFAQCHPPFAAPVSCGKMMLLRRLQAELEREGKLLVSKSLSVDKDRTTVPTLIAVLFYDLSPDKEPRSSTQGERRERDRQELFRRGRKPVALFVDEAHDLHAKIVTGLKRLMEVVADGE